MGTNKSVPGSYHRTREEIVGSATANDMLLLSMFILAEGKCTTSATVFGDVQDDSAARHVSKSKRDLGTTYSANIKRVRGQYGDCWDGVITNPQNPQRRDVQMLLPGGYIVVEWHQV